ncbi:MAG: LysM peptidoglycan-binding domain-containing protein [Firmicutes bacterium]|nr:LysM peptidoglycan-binding domain-containing protein [Bacillota bacterium]
MDDYKTYTIVKGDNLTKIARAFGTTVDELVKLNGIENPNLIYAGAELKIPFTAEELAAKAEEAAKAAAEAAKKEAEERMAAAAARLAEEKKAAEEAAAQAAAKVEETVEEVKEEATEKKGLFASLFKKKS